MNIHVYKWYTYFVDFLDAIIPQTKCTTHIYWNKYSPIRSVKRNLLYFYASTLHNLNYGYCTKTTERFWIITKYPKDMTEIVYDGEQKKIIRTC